MRPDQLRGHGEKILLVEDDRDLMNLTRDLLTDNNYVVHACRGISDAEFVFTREKGSSTCCSAISSCLTEEELIWRCGSARASLR